MGFLRLLHFFLIATALCVSSVVLSSATAWAQEPFAAPAHIAVVDGQASLERDGQLEPAVNGAPFIPGDRLRTSTGRVEVLFPDGSALDIDEFSEVDLQAQTLLRLTAGRLLLTVAGAEDPASALQYQIDTPVASATTNGPGEYRIALFSSPNDLQVELAVTRGLAVLATERGTATVRAGERSLAREFESPLYPQVFNSARFDAFDRWAASQREARLGASASSQYLPSELRMYSGTLDRAGAWQYEAPYGYVWYPTVAVDWRPYYHGYWSAIRPYGWTWIGVDVWGWPTHHYGRWGYARSRWFWIPHHRWGPAWVSWGYAPGYVSWCPLGFDGYPVFSLSVSIRNRWTGWTVVSHDYFDARATYVHDYAVTPHRLASSTFVPHAASPIQPRYAAPRNAAASAASAVTDSGLAGTRRAIPRSPTQPAVGSPAEVRPGTGSATLRQPSVARQPIARSPRTASAGGSTAGATAGAGRSRVDATGRTGTSRSAISRDPQRAVTPAPGGRLSGGTARERQPSTVARPPASTGRQPLARSPRSTGSPDPSSTTPSTERGGRRAIPRGAPSASPQAPSRDRGEWRAFPRQAPSAAGPGALHPRASPQGVRPAAPGGSADGPARRTSEPRSGVRSGPPSRSSSAASPARPQRQSPGARSRSLGASPPAASGRSPATRSAVPRSPNGGSGSRASSGGRAESGGSAPPGRTPAARRRP